jgi:hypothetical protein
MRKCMRMRKRKRTFYYYTNHLLITTYNVLLLYSYHVPLIIAMSGILSVILVLALVCTGSESSWHIRMLMLDITSKSIRLDDNINTTSSA